MHSFCGAVSWLLSTYGREADLRLAASRLGALRQSIDETPRRYQERLVSAIGHLRTDSELKSQFIYGVRSSAQATITALKHTFDSPWEELMAAAEAGDIRQRGEGSMTPRPRPSINLVDAPDASVRSEDVVWPTWLNEDETDEKEDMNDTTSFLVQQFLLTEPHQARGDVVCYLCFRPGHIVPDCDLLPPDEMAALKERRAAFLERKSKSPWTRNKRWIPRNLPLTPPSESGPANRPPHQRPGY